jgi:uncharacterized membrane protein YphA (DoxX/SURF4 family)
MNSRLVTAFGAWLYAASIHAHPGHPTLNPQHVHVGAETDLLWIGLIVAVALLAGGRIAQRIRARTRGRPR